eukprot:gene20870-biopygen6994
MSTGLRDGAH